MALCSNRRIRVLRPTKFFATSETGPSANRREHTENSSCLWANFGESTRVTSQKGTQPVMANCGSRRNVMRRLE